MSSARFYQPVYFYNNPLIGGAFQTLGSAPAGGVTGSFYYDTVSGAPRFQNAGGSFDLIATDSVKLGGQAPSYYLARGNGTGTQTASTISDLSAVVKAFTLDSFAAPAANIPMGGKTFTGLPTTYSGAGFAAEQSWVISQISSAISGGVKAVKDPVRVLFAANIALSGIPTSANADGVTLAVGDRVITTAQTTASQNGLWLVQSGAWTRPNDWSSVSGIGYSGIEPGTEILVQEGATYLGTVQRITTTGNLTVDTSAVAFTQVNKINTYTNGNGLALTGTVFSVQVVAGGGITVSASGIAIDKTIVGTKFNASIGDGSASSFTVTHNLASQDVDVTVRDTGTNELVQPMVTAPTVNTVVVTFSGYVPTANQFRVKVSA